MNGFLNLLKPPGMTSSDAVLRVRKALPRGVRVGHGGTLDPDAAGVLPICVGKATRLFDYIVDKEKRYIAEMTLGIVTDTQDASGTVLETRPVQINEENVRAVLPEFTGEILQSPPAYSAIKRDGRRMYELARRGEAVDLAPRPVTIHALELLERVDARRYLLSVTCGKGAYIRTLCHDIGARLGCGGHMSFLLREKCGAFSLEDAVTLEELDGLEQKLLPLDHPLGRYPALELDRSWEKAVRNGNALPAPDRAAGEILRVYLDGEFAGMAQADGLGQARFRAMLWEAGPRTEQEEET